MTPRVTRRVALVVNPASGAGRGGRLVDSVARRLGAAATVEVHRGATAEESAQAIAAAAGSCDAVVVLGGDGMVHLAAQALALGNTPLGIVPVGTGNDAAGTLGIPDDPIAAADLVLAALRDGSVRRIDLGRTDTGCWWVTVLCAGFDSAVSERANAMRRPRGRRRYDLAIATELVRLAPRPFRLTTDGAAHDGPAILVAVGNGPRYGGGKRICHGAEPDDGMFLVGVVRPIGRLALARLAPTLPRAGHVDHPRFERIAARSVTLDAPGTVAYADGERIGTLPLTIDCVSAALPVLVPPAFPFDS